MNAWQEVLDNPVLQNLPYKIELNEWGKIVMSPASNWHGYIQVELSSMLLRLFKSGRVISECSVQTTKGVKVADVVWCSKSFITTHKLETPFEAAPELCIGIISPSNSPKELAEKMLLYFDGGAKEVWFCDENGNLTFHSMLGQLKHSAICPKMKPKLKV